MSKASPEQLSVIGERAAALIKSGDRVGLGSGKAALAFVRALGKRCRDERLNIVAVSSSLLTESVAADVGIPLASLYDVDALDIAVDGADEVDPHLNLIKGGGGNLTREKVLAAIAKRYVAVVGGEKIVARLGANFPVFVEVIEFARPVVTRLIERMGATVTTRANPDGTPFLTDNHNPYLHCRFGPPPYTLSTPGFLEDQLRILPGVVETGLFINLAHEILVANADGTIGTLRK